MEEISSLVEGKFCKFETVQVVNSLLRGEDDIVEGVFIEYNDVGTTSLVLVERKRGKKEVVDFLVFLPVCFTLIIHV